MMLSGCTTKETSTKETGKTGDEIEIGFLIDTLVVERWSKDRDIFVTRANELGAQVNVQNAQGDVSAQKEQMEYLMEQGVDVIVVVPVDAGSLVNEIAAAHKKGIKVVCYDRLATDSNADLYVSFDNETVGSLMVKGAFNKVGKKAKVAIVNGPTSDNNVHLLKSGMMKKIKEYGWEIVDETCIEGWKTELAYEYANNNFDKIKDCNAVICGNDGLAGAVINALAEKRLAGTIAVTGQDADLEACQRIVEGTQTMTVYKDITSLARTAAEEAVTLAKGEDVFYDRTINDGKQDIPYVCVEPVAVDRYNMDDVIVSGGFHLREEVYLNVE
ncbi:MAG: substrate-binding domain-containing protein [Lachnospiraceae bacterium]|nr:substrate-binding domain-containing protein [Lachnospiraceae bacterium]